MGIRNFIFGIKQRLMPTASGVDAQQIIMREVGGGKTSYGCTFWCS